jgi:hypothetical protein
MQFREIIAIHSENHKKHTYVCALCGENYKLFNVKASLVYSIHCS